MSKRPEPDLEMNAHAAWDNAQFQRAFRLFERGAICGIRGCMLDLGYFYDVGIGTRADKSKAMYWYMRAYRLKDGAAASNIAILYRERGNNRLAFHWFKRAADLGDGDANLELAKCYLAGRGAKRSISRATQQLRITIASKSVTPASKLEARKILARMSTVRFRPSHYS